MTHNPECGLDCVSAGAVRLDNTPSADQQTGRQYLSGDQSAEQARHTPGPWVSRRSRFLPGYVQIDADDKWDALAQVVVEVDGESYAPGEANARLIAAAPEMLEALKSFSELVNHPDPFDREDVAQMQKTMRLAKAAIAKAEGRDR